MAPAERGITILGMGNSGVIRSFDMGQHIRTSEVWGLNNDFVLYDNLVRQGRFTRWYELHDWADLRDRFIPMMAERGIDYLKALDALEIPIYVQEPLPLIRNQVIIPRDEICRGHATNFASGTPSRMLQHALWEHDQGNTIYTLDSFGIDCLDGDHAKQLPAWSWWMAEARLRGIDIGGTALDYQSRPEPDAGLRTWRTKTEQALVAYEPRLAATMNPVDALGVCCTLPPPPAMLEECGDHFTFARTSLEHISALLKCGPVLVLPDGAALVASPALCAADIGQLDIGFAETPAGAAYLINATDIGCAFFQSAASISKHCYVALQDALAAAIAIHRNRASDIGKQLAGCLKTQMNTAGEEA